MERLVLSGPRLELVSCDLELVEMIMNDRPALAAALEAVVPDGWPVSPEIQPIFLETLRKNPDAAGWLGYAAILKEGRTVVGDIGFLGPPDPDGSVEIGYSILPEFRGRGLAAEMTAVLIRRAFTDARVRRVVAHTDADNPASMRVLEKNGFRRKGTSDFLDQGEKIFWVLDREDVP